MNVVARLVLGFLWLLSWLPLALQAAVGRGLGKLLWVLAGSRRRIALRNLELTMPDKTPQERRAIARENFQWIARSILERGLLWYASPERLRRLIHVEGDIGFAERTPDAVMWLAPHFVALDVAGQSTQLFQNRQVGSIYQRQSIPVFDEAIRKGRLRFANGQVFSRHEKALPLIRAIRRGYAFFNLPDMDFGPQEAVFVPFMGVPAATLTAPSKMARSLAMTVQPVVAEILPGGQGYRVRYLEPWKDFPTDDPVADAARMNEWIASEVRRNPSQYYWVHKRFKTRPPGEPSLY
ncbi:MAG: lipid A biosynthesis acyltransferase [Burkholderiales bacterium]|nr:lipid A biosynthesis acyltransferase [Burkholderiales bacterium]